MRDLTPKQKRFITEYLIDLNATQACIRAGYSERNAGKIGPELLGKTRIAAAIGEKTAKQLNSRELSAARILEEMRRCALVDIRTLFDAQGNLKPIHTLTEEEAAAIGGFEVIKKNAEAGDGVIDTIHKVKVLDKTKSLEMLGKYFGLLMEHVKHSGEVTVTVEQRLSAGRQRLAKVIPIKAIA